MKPYYAEAWSDLVDGTLNWRIWSHLGWQEVKRRYRRTVLGPFWATLSIAMFVGGMSFIWAPLFRTSVGSFMPYLTAGMVTWSLVVALISEGCHTYTSGINLITTLRFPYSILNYNVIWRNVIVFFHNVLVVVIVNAIMQVPVTWSTLLVIPGLIIVCLNGIWITMLFGLFSTRFRDIPPLVANITQILMFVTPIFWQANQLGERGQTLISFNYVYHLIDVMRAPMLGQTPSTISYAVTIGGAILGWALAFALLARFKHRIPYWL